MSKKQFLIKSLACLLVLSMLSACGGESTDKDKDKDNSSIISSTDNNSSEDNSSSEDNNSSEDTSSSDDGSQTEETDNYDDEPGQPRPWQTYTPLDDSYYDDSDDTLSDGGSSDDEDEEIVIPYTKEDLLEIMEYLTFDTDNYAIGVHASGAIDVSNIIRKFERKVGHKPAVFDFDMTNLAFDISDRALQAAVNQLVEFAAQGGIITITDHSLAPNINISDASAGGANNSRMPITREEFLDVMVEGTEVNKNFREEYAYKVKFLKMLEENNVPVIFRPLHEANGGWFWWGVNYNNNGVTNQDVANLYVYIHDYFSVENGLTNILWQYNTGMAGGKDPYGWWPGEEYIDLISTDWYATLDEVESGNSYNYIPFYNGSQELGKRYAYGLAEFGGDGTYNAAAYDLKKSLNLIEAQIEKGAKCAYVGLYFEFGSDQDCTLTDNVITLDEMQSYWDKVLK